MGAVVYMLSALISSSCAWLLLRAYIRGRRKLLLWSGLCFTVLAISNFLVFADLVLLPQVDLYLYRLATAAIAMVLLIFGLIWESK